MISVKADGDFDFNEREGMPGVYRFDGTTFNYHEFPIEMPPDRRGDYSVTGIDQSKEGRVWIATYGVVIGFDGESFTIINDDSLGHTEDTGYLHARCVFEDSKGRVWIGNNGIGVVMRDGENTTNFTQAHGVGRRFLPIGAPRSPGGPAMRRLASPRFIGSFRSAKIGTATSGSARSSRAHGGTTARR